MPYIGRSSNFGVRTRFLYTATASQTTFSGTDTQNLTLSYSDSNFIDVHQNGVLLKVVDDYTATSGTSVVLATGATASDVIEITVYDVFSIANHIKKTGDAMAGALTNIDIDGTELILDGDGDTSITADTDDQIDIRIGGTDVATFTNSSSDFVITQAVQDKDIIFKGDDGGSAIEAARFDMSVGGFLGLGTTSPTSRIEISGDTFTKSTIRLERTNNGENNDAGLQFKSAAGANSGYGMGGIWFKNSLDDNAYALIRARTDDSSGTSGRLDFITSTDAVSNTTAACMTIDSSGHITKPKQSAFLVTKSSAQTDTDINQNVIITFDTERFDQNGDFASNTFTAPVTGRYQLNTIVYTSDAPNDLAYFTIRLITSNREYYSIFDPGQAGLSGANSYHTLNINVLADMDANDTAYVNFYTPTGTAQTNIEGSHVTSFSGFLAC